MTADDTIRRSFTIPNERGLHARAATLLVHTVSRFDAEVLIDKAGTRANGRSVMSLLILAATKGSTIQVEARGPERQAAMDAVTALIERRFDEEE
ncbi:MAG: hypothetical protein AMXMBFR64_16860 [Myxococcales bacterium]